MIHRQKDVKAINEELLKEKEKNLDQLVENNINLVHHIIHRKFYYVEELEEYEDIFQEGVVGLMIGISEFDPEKGIALSTYVSYWIIKKIREYLKKSYMDYLNIEEISCMDPKAIIQLESVESRLLINKALHVLTEQEKEIIIHRYGLFSCTPLTLQDLSLKLKKSTTWVFTLEKRALKKMREYLYKN